jgi:hypothetical protein
MALMEEDFDRLGEYVRNNMAEWLADQSLSAPPLVYEIELRERIVRVEEELKHQRELMKQGFALMEKRFEQMDRRFEQIDRRSEQADDRFGALTKRIDRFMLWSFGLTVTATGLIITVIKL